MNIYTVLDEKSEIHQRPFFETNDETAKRAFELACSDNSSLVGMAPQDFSLHCLGMFDDEGGEIIPTTRRMVMRGTDLFTTKLAEAVNNA